MGAVEIISIATAALGWVVVPYVTYRFGIRREKHDSRRRRNDDALAMFSCFVGPSAASRASRGTNWASPNVPYPELHIYANRIGDAEIVRLCAELERARDVFVHEVTVARHTAERAEITRSLCEAVYSLQDAIVERAESLLSDAK